MMKDRIITYTSPVEVKHESRRDGKTHQVWWHLPEASYLCEPCLEARKKKVEKTLKENAMKRHDGTELEKVREQLKAAHETIDVLRADSLEDNASAAAAVLQLMQGIGDVLRFHDDCLCRHAKQYLTQAMAISLNNDHSATTPRG